MSDRTHHAGFSEQCDQVASGVLLFRFLTTSSNIMAYGMKPQPNPTNQTHTMISYEIKGFDLQRLKIQL